MKLLIKTLVLFLISPTLMFPFAALFSYYEEHPPIVRQVVSTEIVESMGLAGSPLYTDRMDTCDAAWRDFKSYMNYEKITSTGSQQYKFISEFMITDSEDGLLRLEMDEKFIGVALGSYFGEIGSKFKFTLQGGKEIYAVKVEEKADEHTLEQNCVQKYDSSIIEFVVNDNFKSYYPDAYAAGNLAVLPQFEGMIIKIEIIKG